ncbi:fructose-specific PTS transporter subunit EIIC [uncultured Veillonella sp.]|uniref:PTS fructose transporter subunit IIABC n=1 Tax=uncultured Veillonella sp. TaxID=159268 RepID=UPI0025F1EA11|nr:fructose-specific PTS transporter subunit EIIC [uncultured Veillonella sp.]MDY3974414.1 fructose-specific PTS transporter subunit EIIC [Veillonella caviae]
MKITDLLKEQSILLQAAPATKKDAILLLGDLMEAGGHLSNKEQYVNDVLAREATGTTGLSDGIATPHAKSAGVKTAGLAAMVVPNGMDFESLDGQPANLFFMIAAPDGGADTHIELLSRLATIVMDADFRAALLKAQTVEGFLALIDVKDANQFAPGMTEADAIEQANALNAQANSNDENSTKNPAPTEDSSTTTAANAASGVAPTYRVLAVTACPTGIAHTYMAAESLERTAQDMGISIKVEKNGQSGVKDPLQTHEIEAAECIIVAADKNVPMARFNGKPVIQVKVSAGINKAKELLTEAISGQVPRYESSQSESKVQEASSQDSLGRQIYKHLMNGVSHMLPFVIGGGILIAIAFLLDVFDPANPSKFGSGTPLAAFFMQIGGASFSFMLPVLAGFIAMSIADRPGLAVGFVGGYLANTGGSGFLGALIAGFVAGYLMLLLKRVFSVLPDSLEGIKPVLLYPVLGVLLMGVLITFAINPPVGAINEALTSSLQNMGTSSRVLIGLIFAGMMAVDMGGPVNKAAYVTGTALLASGEYGVMAAVMAGGMVPPLAIALCTTFFGNRFTANERKSGITNYVMGFSFITEGAIPFAAADPLRVIPACVVGAATSGALSMIFDCTLRAPHGGIFVVPTIGNPLMYLLSILVGSIITCLLLAVLKKPIKEQ